MLVAVLIGIMISIVVGVSLIPTILTTIDALPTNTPDGLVALVNVLPYVFVAVILLGAVSKVAALQSNLHRITSQIRGNLKAEAHGNPELNGSRSGSNGSWNGPKCVETRGFASHYFGMVG